MPHDREQSVPEKNKHVVAEYTSEFWGKGNTDVVDVLCADDFVSDCPLHGRRPGKAQVKKMIVDFREASFSPPNLRGHDQSPTPRRITNSATGFP